MRAHDVRHLRLCTVCDDLGDDRNMINPDPAHSTRWYHGRCFIKRCGLKQLLKLPAEQANRLTLGDVGVRTMKALIRASSQLTAEDSAH